MLARVGASTVKRSVVLAFLAVSLFACGGPSKPAAAPESDPWADYKGTFAEPGGAHAKTAPPPKTAKADAPKESVGTSSAPLTAAADPEPQAPAKAKAKRKASGSGGGKKAKKAKKAAPEG